MFSPPSLPVILDLKSQFKHWHCPWCFSFCHSEEIHLLLKTQRFSYSWIPAQNVAALTTTWKRERHFISFLLSIWVFCFLHLKFWTAVPGCSAQTRVSSVIIWITCISLALHKTHSHKGLGSLKSVSADCPPTLLLWSYRQTVLVFAVCF